MEKTERSNALRKCQSYLFPPLILVPGSDSSSIQYGLHIRYTVYNNINPKHLAIILQVILIHDEQGRSFTRSNPIWGENVSAN